MSLHVPNEVIERAMNGDVSDAEFIDCVRESLPEAWKIFAQAAEELRQQGSGPAIVEPAEMTEEKRGQLLRALSSNAIRSSVESYFGVVYAFQNCHKTAAFNPSEIGSDRYMQFISTRAQILNQRPGFVDC